MTETFNTLKEHPHKRYNILTGEWILVSPHRTLRPWQGKTEVLQTEVLPQRDDTCYLCPGNKRADGTVTPEYKAVYTFVNDYSALLEQTPAGEYNLNNLLVAKNEAGICKVICFSPRHDLTISSMPQEMILTVIEKWCEEFEILSENKLIRYIQIFENKGDVMGCSNPHPHGQIWANSSLPAEIIKETRCQLEHYQTHHISLLQHYLDIELKKDERIVCSNEHFVALVPFWAVWPFETMIISRRHVQDILQFSEEEKAALAAILKELTTTYDQLFFTSFPYSAGIHQSPVNDGPHPEWHWHMHFYPPLLRSATVKKFMVGYEMLANPQRDITPEWAAEKLRSVHEKYFNPAELLHG